MCSTTLRCSTTLPASTHGTGCCRPSSSNGSTKRKPRASRKLGAVQSVGKRHAHREWGYRGDTVFFTHISVEATLPIRALVAPIRPDAKASQRILICGRSAPDRPPRRGLARNGPAPSEQICLSRTSPAGAGNQRFDCDRSRSLQLGSVKRERQASAPTLRSEARSPREWRDRSAPTVPMQPSYCFFPPSR
jgi:hypothetical protein